MEQRLAANLKSAYDKTMEMTFKYELFPSMTTVYFLKCQNDIPEAEVWLGVTSTIRRSARPVLVGCGAAGWD